MKKLRIILNYNQKYTIILFILVIIYSLIITNIKISSKYSINEEIFIGKIININNSNNKTTIIIKGKEKLLVKHDTILNNLNVGDTIKIKGKLEIPQENTNFNLFNYRKYLSNNKIYFILKSKKIIKIKNNTNIFNYYKSKLENYINSKKANAYLSVFILSNKNNIEEDVIDSYRKNGLSHLFSISGMHITLILLPILKLLDKISYNRWYKYFILIIVLLIYMFLTNYTPSIVRSGIMFILLALNKLFNLKFKTINIIMLVLVISLIINPYYIYDIGFQLSYIISFYLILFSNKINKYKNYFTKLFIVSFISFLVSFPIIINNYFEINIISVFINLLFVPLISYLVLPLSFLNLIIPIDNIIIIIMKTLENISLYLANTNCFSISFSKPNICLIIIYYMVITITLYKIKYLIFLLSVIFYHQIKVYFNPNMNIIFLDVKQGDSTLLYYPHNKLNILIDTGGTHNYEITKHITIPYMKSIGIKKLDYLIITHGDYDHIGSSIYLINNFKINNVILNIGKYNELEQELIKILEYKKIKYYKNLKEIKKGVNQIIFLNTKEYSDENNNSSVVYFINNDLKFLFMGDASQKREEDIINKYKITNIDFLKIGHHGSNTSTSKKFIEEIKPKNCFISVGKNNIYNFPKKAVLDILKKCNNYRTDINGSIKIKITKEKYAIETCN